MGERGGDCVMYQQRVHVALQGLESLACVLAAWSASISGGGTCRISLVESLRECFAWAPDGAPPGAQYAARRALVRPSRMRCCGVVSRPLRNVCWLPWMGRLNTLHAPFVAAAYAWFLLRFLCCFGNAAAALPAELSEALKL